MTSSNHFQIIFRRGLRQSVLRNSLMTNEIHQIVGDRSSLGRLPPCGKRAKRNFAQYLHGDGHNFEPTTRTLAYAWLDQHLRGIGG